jgi:hypothetical protein
MLSRASKIQKLWKKGRANLVKEALYVLLPNVDSPNYKTRIREHVESQAPLNFNLYTVQPGDTIDVVIGKKFRKKIMDSDDGSATRAIRGAIEALNAFEPERELEPGEQIKIPIYEEILWGNNLGSALYVLKLIGEDSYIYYVGETSNIFRRFNQHKHMFSKRNNVYFDRVQFIKDKIEEEYYHSGANVIDEFKDIKEIKLQYVEFLKDPGKNANENRLYRLKRERDLVYRLIALYGEDKVRGAKWTRLEYAQGIENRMWKNFEDYRSSVLDLAKIIAGEEVESEIEAREIVNDWREEHPDEDFYELPLGLNQNSSLINFVQSAFVSSTDVITEKSFLRKHHSRSRTQEYSEDYQRGHFGQVADQNIAFWTASLIEEMSLDSSIEENWKTFLSIASEVFFIGKVARAISSGEATLSMLRFRRNERRSILVNHVAPLIKSNSIEDLLGLVREELNYIKNASKAATALGEIQYGDWLDKFVKITYNRQVGIVDIEGANIFDIEGLKSYLIGNSHEYLSGEVETEQVAPNPYLFNQPIGYIFKDIKINWDPKSRKAEAASVKLYVAGNVRVYEGEGDIDGDIINFKEIFKKYNEVSQKNYDSYYKDGFLKKLLTLIVITNEGTCETELYNKLKKTTSMGANRSLVRRVLPWFKYELNDIDDLIHTVLPCIREGSILSSLTPESVPLLEQAVFDSLDQLNYEDLNEDQELGDIDDFVNTIYESFNEGFLADAIDKIKRRYTKNTAEIERFMPVNVIEFKKITGLEELRADEKRLEEVQDYLKNERSFTDDELARQLRGFYLYMPVDFFVELTTEEVLELKVELDISDKISFVKITLLSRKEQIEALEELNRLHDTNYSLQDLEEDLEPRRAEPSEPIKIFTDKDDSDYMSDFRQSSDEIEIWNNIWENQISADLKNIIITAILQLSHLSSISKKSLPGLYSHLITGGLLLDTVLQNVKQDQAAELKNYENLITFVINYMPPTFLQAFRFKEQRNITRQIRESDIDIFWNLLKDPDITTVDQFMEQLVDTANITADPRILNVIFASRDAIDFETFRGMFKIPEARRKATERYRRLKLRIREKTEAFLSAWEAFKEGLGSPGVVPRQELEPWLEDYMSQFAGDEFNDENFEFYKNIYSTVTGRQFTVSDRRIMGELRSGLTISYTNETAIRLVHARLNRDKIAKIIFSLDEGLRIIDDKLIAMNLSSNIAPLGGAMLGRIQKVTQLIYGNPAISVEKLINKAQLYSWGNRYTNLKEVLENMKKTDYGPEDVWSFVSDLRREEAEEGGEEAVFSLVMRAVDRLMGELDDKMSSMQTSTSESDAQDAIFAEISRWLDLRKFAFKARGAR